MTEILIAAENVEASHPGRPPVLRGVTLRLRRGTRLALLGANGSGKTTLLRVLVGAHRPLSGQVVREGETLGYSRSDLRRHRRQVQLVLQDPDDQLFSADVTQDVSFGPANLGLETAEIRARVAEALALLGISHLAERATHQLSYGERKRVATAGAVAMRPSVLLLDEPTAGLDPAGTEQMLDALERLHTNGTTIVFATHDVDLALRWADEAAVVCLGDLTQGPAADILGDSDLIARAHLKLPWTLDVTGRLGLPGRPRTIDEVVGLLRRTAPR